MDTHTTPAEKPLPPKRTPEELERLKKAVESIRKWVRRRFPE